jgi:hypothetical protein
MIPSTISQIFGKQRSRPSKAQPNDPALFLGDLQSSSNNPPPPPKTYAELLEVFIGIHKYSNYTPDVGISNQAFQNSTRKVMNLCLIDE